MASGKTPTRPDIMEMFGQPELFADGWIVRESADTIQILFYVTRKDENREVVRIHMPRSGYEVSCSQSAQEVIGTAAQ